MGNCSQGKRGQPDVSQSNVANKITPDDEIKYLVLSQLSHDLNSCLCSIMLGIDLLLDPNVPALEKTSVEKNMRSSYEFILMLSRKTNFFFSSEKIQAKMGIINIAETLQKVIGIVQQMTLIPIHSIVDPNVPRFTMSDPAWIWDILLNLLGNAKKFTVKGLITIHVQMQNHMLLFSVKDTGVGIPVNRRDQLFKAFKTSDTSNGTGVGLYGCKLKMDSLSGSIGYLPNIPEGSIFWFSFPHVECSHFSQEMISYSVDTVSTYICSQLNFLIVDDDVLLLRLIKTFFQRFKVNVVTVSNISEAKRLVRSYAGTRDAFHCVISDKIFTDTSNVEDDVVNRDTGFELIKWIRENDFNIYTCLLTGSLTLREVSDLKIDIFLKPINKKVSKNIVTKTIEYHSFANVLIVDDDPLICTLLLKFCEHHGFVGTAASNGSEAMDAMTDKKFTLIFMDVDMPVVSGIDFLKQFDRNTCDSYICIISGNLSSLSDEDKSYLQIAHEIQPKPLQSIEMLQVFHRALACKIRKRNEKDMNRSLEERDSGSGGLFRVDEVSENTQDSSLAKDSSFSAAKA
jgi:two-component system sensor histidine kinase/response regulator